MVRPGAEVLTAAADSSRVLSVGLASSVPTILVEVTVGRGSMVLPEGTTVRMVVLLTVGPGGVTVVTCVVGLRVLGWVDLSMAMMSASCEA